MFHYIPGNSLSAYLPNIEVKDNKAALKYPKPVMVDVNHSVDEPIRANHVLENRHGRLPLMVAVYRHGNINRRACEVGEIIPVYLLVEKSDGIIAVFQTGTVKLTVPFALSSVRESKIFLRDL